MKDNISRARSPHKKASSQAAGAVRMDEFADKSLY